MIMDEKKLDNQMPENENAPEGEYYTLVDEEGNELEFEVIGTAELNGQIYYAMIPVDDQPDEEGVCEYVILKAIEEEDGEISLISVEDDDEFDDVADYFEDMLSDEADYDLNAEN
ncbi:MAG: DUF1292 domain-containing protein [Ruminococcaceae bacterium]|nr:DUF1292 domain-containing protein [Oscillospiraceae bacterium]